MAPRPLAKFEFDLVGFLAQGEGLSVRDIHEQFGKPNGYIRGTIVKSMDRLLKKGHVSRELVDGKFVYRATLGKEDLDRQLVESFIHDRLGGSLAPIASFLTESKGLTPIELDQLKELLEKMEP